MEKNAPFEKAYSRLEEILEKMNSSSVALEESLKLYEEADKLITLCSKKLDAAEKKIQTLIKNRDHEAVLDEEGKPVVKEFEKEIIN